MEKYRVPNFIIHTLFNESSVIQTEYGTVILEDARLSNFFINLEENKKYTINFKELQNTFEEETKNIINFFMENNLLFKIHEKNILYDKICIISDEEQLRDILHKLIKEKTKLPIHLYNSEELNEQLSSSLDNTLIINFMDSYRNETVNKIIETVNKSSNSSLLLSHVYNSAVLFHCMYSSNHMTPCPKCTKGVITGQIYESQGGVTYQQLLKMVYDLDDEFNVNFPLSFKNKLLISNQIADQLEYFLSDDYSLIRKRNNEFSDIFRLDLSNNQITKDSAIYWELCDCYERI